MTMNNRLKRKAEKQKREQIHKLLDLVLDINGLGQRQKKITGNRPTAFFEFSGHVGWVETDIRLHGYADGDDGPRRVIRTYTKDLRKLKEAVCEMESIKAETPGAATPGESR